MAHAISFGSPQYFHSLLALELAPVSVEIQLVGLGEIMNKSPAHVSLEKVAIQRQDTEIVISLAR